MTNQEQPFTGLTAAQVAERQKQFGKNALAAPEQQSLLKKFLHVLTEPMFLLLLVAAVIYFILGEPQDGAMMLVFVAGMIAIDTIQEWKTDRTLEALKDLSAPHITVIRDGQQTEIPSAELVPGDLMIVSEGVKIPADGPVLKASDLCVDESLLTGESEGVWKSPDASDRGGWRKDYCYAGTLVIQGSGYLKVEKTGAQTEYGKIGAHVAAAPERPTPLQKQTQTLVKICAVIAAAFFLLVAVFTWFNLSSSRPADRVIESVLSGITLAMAMIPEEFPVILTVFLSMGAWRLARKHSLVRRLPCVETLGMVSVLCTDKTGTITLNQMTVDEIWAFDNDEPHLCEVMGLGCETDAYDPMEKAMLEYCENRGITREHLLSGRMLVEYPFTNTLKIMGHVWYHDDEIMVAAKGSPEFLLTLCGLTEEEQRQADQKVQQMSQKGLRVIAVAEVHLKREEDIPAELTQCKLRFCGLIGLMDPPRESVKRDIESCVKAGVRVIMITGDNGITASNIARQIGMPNADRMLTGAQIDQMTEQEFAEQIRQVNIFSRVVPEHKMRIVKALQAEDQVVAMTGDGVNDAPALKFADIGIAMGKRGSEVSREAADLILMDDNFSTIVDTIRDGRRIYDNICKAVGYVFAIHVPIALASLLAPLLKIAPDQMLLLPLHVVLLELMIDPTCSIVLERQPAERDIMERPPRSPSEGILSAYTLGKSILQGLFIFAASFGSYYVCLTRCGAPVEAARAMGLVAMIFANLFLVQVNSSNTDSVFQSVRCLAADRVMWIVDLATVAGVLVILYTPLSGSFRVMPLSLPQLGFAVVIAAASVFWYELVKLYWRSRQKRHPAK